MYVAVSIAVKDTTLPTIPPFVEPFIVITSLDAPGTKAFFEPSSTPIMIAVDDGSKKAFIPGASNDVITMNGSTKGGIVGSVVSFTAIDTATYMVHNSLLLGSGTIVTPYADA